MAELPPLTYGKVVGRFMAINGSVTTSPDDFPNAVPLSGSIYLRPTPTLLRIVSAQPVPVSAVPQLVVCTLDGEGYLTRNGERFAWILATDDPATNPTDYTWEVSFDLDNAGRAVQLPGYPFNVETWDPNANGGLGNPVDLTVVAPLISSGGVLITKGDKGDTGPEGPQGDIGPQGPQGDAGPGVAAGGTTGQILKKASATDFDTSWADQLPIIPGTANLNDYTTPGVYSLVDPSNTGPVAHDTTIVDPLWNGTFFGRWARLTVVIGDPNLYGAVFQTIEFEGDSDRGIEYIERTTYDTLAGAAFYKLTPFTAAPRQIVSIVSGNVVPANSNPGDVWFARNTAQTLTFQKFPTFGNPDILDLTFVTDVRKITFAAAAGITIVVPLGKVATLTRGVARVTGIATAGGGGNGTIFLSGDLDSA